MKVITRISQLGACLVLSGCSNQILKPFTSDGCTAFPDGTKEQATLWLKCCASHDLAYWQGGTYAGRHEADKALQACVSSVGHPDIAVVMLAGVRVGGTPYLPTTFRWGYGWSYPRFYGALNESELAQVESAQTE